MRFNIVFLSLGIILLLTSALFDINYLKYEDPIPFERWKTITLYDFKGLKRPGMTLDGSAEFAYISTSRKLHYTGNGAISITAYFHPSRSYVFDQQIRSPDLLRHELYHFCITEYFTRLLRRDIEIYNGNISHGVIDELNEKYSRLEYETQLRYDEETYHSYVLNEQIRWQTILDDELSSLAAYADPVVTIHK